MDTSKVDLTLLNHPFWDAYNPHAARLVRISKEFPPHLNPFAKDGVALYAACIPGEAPHSKWIVAREGIWHGVQEGKITSSTTVIEATSGNTGDGMAKVCNAIGIRFIAVMNADVPPDKINAIRVVGRRTAVHLISDPEETTVAYARRLGAQEGWYNPDQYSGDWNPEAHATYLVPQFWHQLPRPSLIFVPSGTMGTSLGFARFIDRGDLGTVVVPVVCGEGEEVPGARTLSSIKKDVRQAYQKFFKEEDFLLGGRHESFLLSFLTWGHVVPHLGPSFGLAFSGALQYLKGCKDEGTLDDLRQADGRVRVAIVGPDDCRPYLPLYFGELKQQELTAKDSPKDLLDLLGV